MKILVTGGSGYVGSVLVPALISDGHTVDVMDIEASISGNWITRDIFYDPVKESDLENVNAVIHLASLSLLKCDKSPQRGVEVNYLATKYLAQACKKARVKLLFASSTSVYGVKSELCNEDSTDPEPFNVYGITKLKAESDVLDAGGIVLRKATIYGISPRMRHDLIINQLVREAKTSGAVTLPALGKMIRNCLNINSAVKVYRDCLKLDKSGEVFNISDENVSVLDVGKLVQKTFGCDLRLVEHTTDKRSCAVDSTKAIKGLNFEPKPLADGIREMKST